MLLEFIAANRAELIKRTQAKVRARAAPKATTAEVENGVPIFLGEFVKLLEGTTAEPSPTAAIGGSATRHGNDLLRRGFTIAQVVHDYGDVCQSATELAGDLHVEITIAEFHTLNLCLDNAIAEAVTEYSRQREQNLAGAEVERLGFLAHELRNLISTATLAFGILRGGTVAINGSTGDVLGRSLTGLRDLIDRSLAEVRLSSGGNLKARIPLAAFLEEMEVSASLDARARKSTLVVAPFALDVEVDADRQLLASAVSNLVQNAFKFGRAGGRVELRARVSGGRVLIEVEDECGGLPPGRAEELFRPFERRGFDRSGLGLGLAISRRSVELQGGKLRVENLPGKGCIFVVDLPLAPPANQAAPNGPLA